MAWSVPLGHDCDLGGFSHVTRLFPLPGVVLLPHVVVPLHIFEPRYRQMTEDALASDGLVTMVRLREPIDWSQEPRMPLEEFACLGKILRHERLADGRFHFLLLGLKRVRLVREIPVDTLYRQAEVEVLEDEPSCNEPCRASLVGLFRELVNRQNALDPELECLLDSDVPLGVLTDILVHALGLPPHLKQAFLADTRVGHRAEGLVVILRELNARLTIAEANRNRYPPPINLN